MKNTIFKEELEYPMGDASLSPFKDSTVERLSSNLMDEARRTWMDKSWRKQIEDIAAEVYRTRCGIIEEFVKNGVSSKFPNIDLENPDPKILENFRLREHQTLRSNMEQYSLEVKDGEEWDAFGYLLLCQEGCSIKHDIKYYK